MTTKIGRNDDCPCGSGKKFKKCHMGREAELNLLPDDAALRITSLPEVDYGRCQEIASRLDLMRVASIPFSVGLKFVDLGQYLALGLGGKDAPANLDQISAGQFINPIKTIKADKANFYLAVTPSINDSTLIHQIAHIIDYLAGSRLDLAFAKPLSLEYDLPLELLEHPQEFGRWLDFLSNEFAIPLDSEDRIIHFLYQKNALVPGEAVRKADGDQLQEAAFAALKLLEENKGSLVNN